MTAGYSYDRVQLHLVTANAPVRSAAGKVTMADSFEASIAGYDVIPVSEENLAGRSLHQVVHVRVAVDEPRRPGKDEGIPLVTQCGDLVPQPGAIGFGHGVGHFVDGARDAVERVGEPARRAWRVRLGVQEPQEPPEFGAWLHRPCCGRHISPYRDDTAVYGEGLPLDIGRHDAGEAAASEPPGDFDGGGDTGRPTRTWPRTRTGPWPGGPGRSSWPAR